MHGTITAAAPHRLMVGTLPVIEAIIVPYTAEHKHIQLTFSAKQVDGHLLIYAKCLQSFLCKIMQGK